MDSTRQSAEILLFDISRRQGALLLQDVVEVHRAVAITPVDEANQLIEGIINVRGELIPVLDLRARFGLPRRAVRLSDRLIIVRAGQRSVAMRVDAADAIISVSASDINDVTRVAPDSQFGGVAKLPQGLMLIYDTHSFVSAAEDEELTRIMAEAHCR